MTPELQSQLAVALKTLAETVEHAPTDVERVVPLDEACVRLGITRDVFRKRRLEREIPVIAYSRKAQGVREVTLNDFIRRREQLARVQLRGVSKRTA